MLVEYVDGDIIEPYNAQYCVALGRALRQLHRAMDEAALGTWRKALGHKNLYWFALMFKERAKLEEELVAGLLRDISLICLERRQSLYALRTFLELGCVHGDIHPGNVVVQNERVNGFLDLADIHFTERGYDVASAIFSFCKRSGDDRLDPVAIDDFLDGYELSDRAERLALPAQLTRRIATILELALRADPSSTLKERYLEIAWRNLRDPLLEQPFGAAVTALTR